ncbi:hypothetical protein NG895_15700 [Aeoliella sp. ICT_H6.2]|uniref:Sulfotransferase family protein n=1 Tax=Aeoliella straminimaris TaxID=2954799 RepID=A0A9X2JH24_9BACT|nr:sulfotransferase family protein [Aeoliella straminimaris]MCO6045356.1 hypothetical protein [Aeoliella straminimaris]
MNDEPKIFCIGFQKTGTSSLGKALEILGYRVCGYQQFRDLAAVPVDDLGDRIQERATDLITQYDAFKDTPWPVLYQLCDRIYPGSKFIHVMRNEDSWIKSVVSDFGCYPNSVHTWIYGESAPLGNEDAYLKRYTKHNQEVMEYFSGRSTDYLRLDLNSGEVNWENICRFLDKETPEIPWPHVNTAKDKARRMLLQRIRGKLNSFFGFPRKGGGVR